jgi:hypothetical protein
MRTRVRPRLGSMLLYAMNPQVDLLGTRQQLNLLTTQQALLQVEELRACAL